MVVFNPKDVLHWARSISPRAKTDNVDAKVIATYAQVRPAIPGIGPVTSAYLLVMLMSGTFRPSDSFVAFLGLDIRIRQSGKKTGRSSLSKRGDPEARRLLYLAARATCRNAGPFHDLYERYRANGMSKIGAAVAVARKIARTAWALYTKNQLYCPQRVLAQGH